jgi:hypothetical protein
VEYRQSKLSSSHQLHHLILRHLSQVVKNPPCLGFRTSRAKVRRSNHYTIELYKVEVNFISILIFSLLFLSAWTVSCNTQSQFKLRIGYIVNICNLSLNSQIKCCCALPRVLSCNITQSEFKLRLHVKGIGYSQFKLVRLGVVAN